MLSEGVYLRALSTNTGKIYWGGATVSSSTGIELAVNESVFIPCKYASAIWLDASVSGEGVRYALI